MSEFDDVRHTSNYAKAEEQIRADERARCAKRIPDRDTIAAIISDRVKVNDKGFVQNAEYVADLILRNIK